MRAQKAHIEKRKVKTQSEKFLVLGSSFALFALSFTLLCGCQKEALHKESRIMMGTFVEVSSPNKKTAEIVFAEIKRIENLLSKYLPGGEVFELNKIGKLKVSPETFYIIKRSIEFSKASNGAFDITVAPLVDLWGFTNKDYRVPNYTDIKSALKLVGSDKIILHENDNVVEFLLPGMKIDLGAIAKGYALDCAVKKLKEEGIISCLINAGGQVYCLGAKSGQPWKIAIREPGSKDYGGYFALQDKSASTSADYEQFFIQKKKRYGHIINPKTGYPADNTIESVTVVAPDGLTADALSTAIFVLGKEKGLSLAKEFTEVEVKIIEKNNIQNIK